MIKSNPFRLKVQGPNACFTRPEMKVERVSYEVMTPSAARGILEAILWKPAIRWEINRIDILNPIKWESVRRNEVGVKAGKPTKAHLSGQSSKPMKMVIETVRQQRASLFLKDVAYVIHCQFEMTARAEDQDSIEKFTEMFIRRASNGQCFHRPYFGNREFAVDFDFIPKDSPDLQSISLTKELGWMLYDMDYSGKEPMPMFFNAKLEKGILNLENVEVRK